MIYFFFFNDTATTEIYTVPYTLSLHDALPISKAAGVPRSTIANLESGDGNPSLAVLVKVANSLTVPIDELLASPRAKVRKWAATDIAAQSQGRGVTMRPLVPEPVPEEMLIVMEFAPRGAMRGTPHLPGTRE